MHFTDATSASSIVRNAAVNGAGVVTPSPVIIDHANAGIPSIGVCTCVIFSSEYCHCHAGSMGSYVTDFFHRLKR